MLTDAGGQVDGDKVACPFHDDANPSGSIFAGETDGSWLYSCHACNWNEGKDTGDVISVIRKAKNIGHEDACERLRALARFNRRDELLPDATRLAELTAKVGQQLGMRIARTSIYTNASGHAVMVVVRYEDDQGKDFRPFHNDGRVWKVAAPAESLPLYNLPRLKAARRVYVVEGEECADAPTKIGLAATTSAFGAKSAKKSDWTPLAGKDVVIFPDNDDDGRSYARDVKAILETLNPPARVGLVELPGLPKRGDIVDFISAHKGTNARIVADLEALAAAAPAQLPEQGGSDDGAWERPVPLGESDLPPFPLDSLPPELCVLRSFCSEVAESVQVPVDLPAMLVLAVGGAALAKRIEVHVAGDHFEPVNLFAVIVMEPGNRKSAVFKHVSAPLLEYEHDEAKRLRTEVAKHNSDREILQQKLKKLQYAATDKDDVKASRARKDAQQTAAELARTPIRTLPRLVVDDATQESLSHLLCQNEGRLALLSADGDVFGLMAGRYSKAGTPNLGVYLKGHAGDDIRVDRVNTDRPAASVRNPALTIGVTVQPNALRLLASNPAFRGRGLLARFLFSIPESTLGGRNLHPDSITKKSERDYGNMVRAALDLMPSKGADGEACPHVVTVGKAARVPLDQFADRVERGLAPGGEFSGMPDWAGKLVGAVCRLAGILHGLQHAGSGKLGSYTISKRTMIAAIRIGEYLIDHARAAYFEIGADPSTDVARRILELIKHETLSAFSRRDVHLALRGLIQKVNELDGPLQILTEHGYIRQIETDHSGPGRKPSQRYEVNPEFLEQNEQNTQNVYRDGHKRGRKQS